MAIIFGQFLAHNYIKIFIIHSLNHILLTTFLYTGQSLWTDMFKFYLCVIHLYIYLFNNGLISILGTISQKINTELIHYKILNCHINHIIFLNFFLRFVKQWSLSCY